jgi:hypothetical protein
MMFLEKFLVAQLVKRCTSLLFTTIKGTVLNQLNPVNIINLISLGFVLILLPSVMFPERSFPQDAFH